jgi:putative NADPH-quinone reductase
MHTTILLFHPDFSQSKANRALADAATAVDGVEVVDMTALYPDGRIDVEAEVQRLLNIGRLVLQFPVQWYSTPPLLKAWQDSVLTRMYYLRAAEEGDRLARLPVLVAATAGNQPSAYTAEGVNRFPLETLLHPLEATAHRCQWRWAKPFLIYGANRSGPAELAEAGERYAGRLREWR